MIVLLNTAFDFRGRLRFPRAVGEPPYEGESTV